MAVKSHTVDIPNSIKDNSGSLQFGNSQYWVWMSTNLRLYSSVTFVKVTCVFIPNIVVIQFINASYFPCITIFDHLFPHCYISRLIVNFFNP